MSKLLPNDELMETKNVVNNKKSLLPYMIAGGVVFIVVIIIVYFATKEEKPVYQPYENPPNENPPNGEGNVADTNTADGGTEDIKASWVGRCGPSFGEQSCGGSDMCSEGGICTKECRLVDKSLALWKYWGPETKAESLMTRGIGLANTAICEGSVKESNINGYSCGPKHGNVSCDNSRFCSKHGTCSNACTHKDVSEIKYWGDELKKQIIDGADPQTLSCV
jgi:hypothetical protein